MDFCVGGRYREMAPKKRLVATERFDDLKLPGEMVMAYVLRWVCCGTKLTVEQAGLPDAIAAGSRRAGRQQCFDLPAPLVESELPSV
jgi:uncharacterized protein YndB with AHSA1/START domain